MSSFVADPLRERMKYRTLGRTNMQVSLLSVGGSGFGNVYGNMTPEESTKTLHECLRRGVNFIDTAPWYGQGKSEEFLGQALKGVPRDKYWITTKVGRYEKDVRKMFDFSPERIRKSIKESLHRLQLEHVDILQLHDVEFAPNIESAPNVDFVVSKALPVMQELKDAGLCRYIGITGYPLPFLKEVIEKSPIQIDTVLSYCHLTLNDSTLVDYLPFFEERGVGVVNASPVAMGLLTESPVPEWHPATEEIRQACAAAVVHCKQEGVNISRLAMDHSLQSPQVATTLTSMVTMEILEKNLDVVYNGLSEKEEEVKKYILEHFFKPLKSKTWEGVEMQRFKHELEKLNMN